MSLPFQTTRWSQVICARAGDTQALVALEGLCTAYRPPVLAYLRQRLRSSEAAEDLAQSFFVHFLEHRVHAVADPARGRFRALLLGALRNFMLDAQHQANAAKRGGGQVATGMDSIVLDAIEGDPRESPDYVFDRAWVLTLIERALDRLRRDAARAGKGALFDRLRGFLLEAPDEHSYAAAAEEFGLRANTLAVTVHRLRAKLRECLRAELQETVGSEAELREELNELRGLLSGVV